MSIRRTNRSWSVSLEFILFLVFFKLFLKMRLTVTFVGIKKSNFLDLWIKSYGCLKFLGEVWAGQACARANEEELTKYKKNWRQEGGGKGAGDAIMGDPQGHSRGPSTATQPAVAVC
jgi:hypothetical protein